MNVRNSLAALLMGAVLILIPGCFPEFPAEGERAGGGHERPLSNTVDIQYGTDATYENIGISFLEVAEDSRCPVDVTCAWEGNARVLMHLQELPNGEVVRVELNTYEPLGNTVEFGGYEVALSNLKPDPISTVPINPRDYVATLQFVKK